MWTVGKVGVDNVIHASHTGSKSDVFVNSMGGREKIHVWNIRFGYNIFLVTRCSLQGFLFAAQVARN